MKQRWLGSIVFILLFVAALITLTKVFPYHNTTDNFLNRILPLDGCILGQEPEAWIGDVATNQRVAGKGRQHLSRQVDVDFIKVKGSWYKIKGPVYITRGGRVLGWHRKITQMESNELGKWLYLVE